MFEDLSILEYPTPIDHRRVGSLFNRMSQSRLLAHILTKEATEGDDIPLDSCVCLFGSVARGEMDMLASDIDLMFVGFSKDARNAFLKRLIERNRGLEFHDAHALLLRSLPEDEEVIERRFPCLTEEMLLGDSELAQRRRIQFLLESQPISGAALHRKIICKLVDYYELQPRPKLIQSPGKFLAEFSAFLNNMAADTANNRKKSADFFAKYLIVRLSWQHLVRLGLVQATRMKRYIVQAENPAWEYAKVLRQTSLSKMLHWGSGEFFSGLTIATVIGQHSAELNKKIQDVLQKRGVKNPLLDKKTDISQWYRQIVFSMVNAYGDALDTIYEPDVLRFFAESSSNIVNWMTNRQMRGVIGHAKGVAHYMLILAETLNATYELAESKGNIMRRSYQGSGLSSAISSLISSAGATAHSLTIIP